MANVALKNENKQQFATFRLAFSFKVIFKEHSVKIAAHDDSAF